jgi:WD40 repeat protein
VFGAILSLISNQSPNTIALIHQARIHDDSIYNLITDPNHRVLIAGVNDTDIKLFTIPSLAFITEFKGHIGWISNLGVNPYSTILLSSSHDKIIRLWSLEIGDALAILNGFTNNMIRMPIFNISRSMIAAACEDGTIPLWTTSAALESNPPHRVITSPGSSKVKWNLHSKIKLIFPEKIKKTIKKHANKSGVTQIEN